MLDMLRENMQGKDIVLFGTGKIATNFYNKYKDKVSIKYFIDNKISEFNGLEQLDIRLAYKKKNIFIVLCCNIEEFRYKLERQLQDNGVEYLKGYVDFDFAEAAIDNKKKVILFIGVCHQLIVCSHISRFSNLFGKYIYINSMFSSDSLHVKEKICKIAQYVICVVISDICGDDRLNNFCREISDKNKIPIVRMPLFYYPLYFPQSNWFTHGPFPEDEEFVRNAFCQNLDARPSLFYMFDDDNLVSMVKKGLTTEEIVNTVSDEDYYSKEYIEKILRRTLRQIEISEQISDIKIYDWIVENYQKKKIYKDKYHFDNQLVFEYSKRITEYIGEKSIDLVHGDIVDYMSVTYERTWLYEMPIYPSVAKHLNLQFIDENTEYYVLKLNHTKKMNFHDIIEDRVNCLKSMIDLKKHLN